jgi:hypothetical protein
MEEYVSRWFALPKSSDNTLAASTLAWLKMATEMTKMIKRVLVFLKFIFGEEVACRDLWTWIACKNKSFDGACGSVWESMNKRRDLYIVAGRVLNLPAFLDWGIDSVGFYGLRVDQGTREFNLN